MVLDDCLRPYSLAISHVHVRTSSEGNIRTWYSKDTWYSVTDSQHRTRQMSERDHIVPEMLVSVCALDVSANYPMFHSLTSHPRLHHAVIYIKTWWLTMLLNREHLPKISEGGNLDIPSHSKLPQCPTIANHMSSSIITCFGIKNELCNTCRESAAIAVRITVPTKSLSLLYVLSVLGEPSEKGCLPTPP